MRRTRNGRYEDFVIGLSWVLLLSVVVVANLLQLSMQAFGYILLIILLVPSVTVFVIRLFGSKRDH